MGKRMGKQTVALSSPPVLRGWAAVAGKKEGEGPLRDGFDQIAEDPYFGEILRQTEGDLAPVSCLECSAAPCPRSADCRTLSLWQELNRRVNDFLDSKTLADLMQTDK